MIADDIYSYDVNGNKIYNYNGLKYNIYSNYLTFKTIVTPNTEYTNISKIKEEPYNEYIIFLDEIHSLIKYLLTCDNLKDRRKKLFSLFLNILKNAKQIIMTDGDICDNCLFMLKSLNRNPFKFIVNEYQANKGIKCYIENDYYK